MPSVVCIFNFVHTTIFLYCCMLLWKIHRGRYGLCVYPWAESKEGQKWSDGLWGQFPGDGCGWVHLVSGHKVNWGGPGGRPREETLLDVCSTMNFPQCKQRAGGIFQEGKLRSTNDSRAGPVKPETLYKFFSWNYSWCKQFPVYMEAFPVQRLTPVGVSCFVNLTS